MRPIMSKAAKATFFFLKIPAGALYLALALFINTDEPVPPAEYNPQWPRWFRIVAWYMRNFAHEFRAHVIGLVGREFGYDGPAYADDYNPEGGWHRHSLICAGRRFRFASYQHRFSSGTVFQAHLGWLKSGRFGAKLRLYRHKVER